MRRSKEIEKPLVQTRPQHKDGSMSIGQGSTGNVIAALCSFFIPGLGQLLQGRLLRAAIQFVLAGVIWFISFGTLGWIVHIWSTLDAALYKPTA